MQSARSILVFVCFVCASAISARMLAQGDICRQAGATAMLPELPEASGIAAESGDGTPLVAINDSGKPLLTLLDRTGKVIRQVDVSGAQLRDWEDVSVGPCRNASCVYIADIGDNQRRRHAITILRVAQPSADAASVPAETFELMYPDGAHDAEAMFITPQGQLFILTKESKGAAIYRAPSTLSSDAPATLTRVAEVGVDRVTDADASSDGRWIALRTNRDLLFLRKDALLTGATQDAIRVDLRTLNEPQGEGVTFGAGGTMYLVGEGGGRGRPGTFVTLRCQLDR